MRQEQPGSQNIAMIPLQFSFLVSFFALSFGFAFARQFLIAQSNAALYVVQSPTVLISFPITLAGVAIGVFLGSWLTLQSGRKIIILSSSVVGIGSFFASCVAPNLSVYLSSYFVIGLTFGLYLLSAILYIAEISLPIQRGIALSYIPLCFTVGILLSLPIANINEIGSLLPFLIAFLIVNLIFITLFFVKVPESPRWLSLVGLSDSSLNVLFKLRLNMGLAAHELAIINDCARHNLRGTTLFFQNNNFRQLIWFYALFVILLHLSGVSFFPLMLSFYMTNSLNYESVFSNTLQDGVLYAVVIVMFIAALICTLFIERTGRRKLLILTGAINSIMLFFIWVFFLTVNEGYSYITLIVLSVAYIFTATLSTSVFLSCFVDIAPTCARDFTVATILFIFATATLIATKLVFEYQDYMTLSTLILIFAVSSTAFMLAINKYLPDTNNLSLEEIERHLFEGKDIRSIGNEIKEDY